MKIKIDENLPEEFSQLLSERGHDVQTVPGEKLVGQPDRIIFDAAQNEDRLLITQDLDFSDIRKFQPGTHPGIILLRLRDPSRRRLIERMRQIINSEDVQSWSQCFVVISDRKLRVRRA